MRKYEAFLSRSISYGRDESEDLYWEMMSSFSHNSSLRKVDRCSKTGSAPEMKAILEACSLRSLSGTDSLVNFNYSSENEMVEEHSANLGSSFLMDSRLEIEVDEVGDHGASNLDVVGVPNQSIALICDKHGVDDDRDASPEGPRVSSLEDIYLPCSSDETNIISPTPLPAVAFFHIEGDFRFLLKENAYDEGGVYLRICNLVVQEYIGKNLVYVAEVCGTLGAYSSFRQKRTLGAYYFFRPKKITSEDREESGEAGDGVGGDDHLAGGVTRPPGEALLHLVLGLLLRLNDLIGIGGKAEEAVVGWRRGRRGRRRNSGRKAPGRR
ncbi:hypothetical protein SASPL_137782 [Salvia splendens]|uniref:Uncharacterized protein n=1 Tax=Salvia splendens TaxID=180675 RepID=A0A8X8ZDQ6_SALSN|nr:hypothetical protein SASPL_137782 [Salvia splendens]